MPRREQVKAIRKHWEETKKKRYPVPPANRRWYGMQNFSPFPSQCSLLSFAALLPPRAKVQHPQRNIPSLPIPKIRQGMPHLPGCAWHHHCQRCAALHLQLPLRLPCLLPETELALGRQFWQHTSLGISSRFATQVLAAGASPPLIPTRLKSMAHCHYALEMSRHPSSSSSSDAQPLEEDQSVYVEQHYGCNLDVVTAEQANCALCHCIAGMLVCNESTVD